MYSLWKISNHPKSQTSLQKLLGKNPLSHVILPTFIRMQRSHYIRGFIKLSARTMAEKGRITAGPTLLELQQSNIPGCSSKPKANYSEHKTEFSGALSEWMALS